MGITIVHQSIELHRIDKAVWGESMNWDKIIEWGLNVFLVSYPDWELSIKRVLVRTMINWPELCQWDFDALMQVFRNYFRKLSLRKFF